MFDEIASIKSASTIQFFDRCLNFELNLNIKRLFIYKLENMMEGSNNNDNLSWHHNLSFIIILVGTSQETQEIEKSAKFI